MNWESSSVLFLATPEEDYLQDQVLTGLRELIGKKCIDIPRKDVLYSDLNKPNEDLYGNGFTIWSRLEPVEVNRNNAFNRVQHGQFETVIFGSIQRQKELFRSAERNGLFETDTNFIFLDGEDYNSALDSTYKKIKNEFKYRSGLVRDRNYVPIFRPALDYGLYFKRELTSDIYKSVDSEKIIETSFSIPHSHIRVDFPDKNQLFQTHVQCEEAYNISEVNESSTVDPIFSDQQEYFDDLAKSKYGITMKKGGWDCMRHYEIAANWTVPCFYKLDDKPRRCAPHGLRDMVNCISFNSAEELEKKIDLIEEHNYYKQLARGAYDWGKSNTCVKRAEKILEYVS